MANQEHVDILKQGAKAWNKWRRQNVGIQPDLSHKYLDEWLATTLVDARNIGTCRNDFRGFDFRNTNLEGSELTNSNLYKVDFRKARLHGVSFNIAYLREANLQNADLHEADLYRSDFVRADLTNTALQRAVLQRADFRGAILRKAELDGANLREADFRGADLSDTSLGGTDLWRADFSGANLQGADFRGVQTAGTIFLDVNLSGANLRGADLSYANLQQVNMHNTDLTKVRLGWTAFGAVNLSTVKGLNTAIHIGPSTIGIDAIISSQGNISEHFLQGAGIPSIFITYIHSLINNPIEYYTCFISYSSKDQEFAERLYADLQANGVRCWFAPEDMKIGDKIRPRIDESIRLYDKLLLVLSERSVMSEWVEYEVEAALDKEQQGKPHVLFPIRLDTAAIKNTTAWACHIRRTRHIGNFECWEDHKEYKKAFNRLLRDLKAGE